MPFVGFCSFIRNRGLGSGIPRVMATGCDVELIDRPDGNQFIARITAADLAEQIGIKNSPLVHGGEFG